MPPAYRAGNAAVTGLGFITCIGNDKDSVLARLRSLETGIESYQYYDNPELQTRTIGRPRGFEFPNANWRTWRWPDRYAIDQHLLRSLPPHGIYAACALTQALEDAGLSRDELADGQTGLYCASAGSPLLVHENVDSLRRSRGDRGNPLGILASIAGTLNFNFGCWLGIQGVNCGYVSACTSGSHAIGYACDDLALGRQKRAIVIGAEDATAESVLPFASMRALSINPDPKTASRPFDADRDGFVGAGGAAVLILENESLVRERGVEPYARLGGWGQGSDGYHRASPHPEGRSLSKSMQAAMEMADVAPEQIDYINAHATSTPVGDLAEAIAIQRTFADAPRLPTVSSTKGLTGHGLSMSGALEAAICALAIRHSILPGNANLSKVDPSCAHLDLPVESIQKTLTCVLNNSSGFGGSNVCHLLQRY